MRHIPFLLLAVLGSCSTPPADQPEMPAALQEPTVLNELKSSDKRMGYGKDLVDALFADALERDTALARMIGDLEDRDRMHRDSVEAFLRFDAQNGTYYEAAFSHVQHVRDTILRAPQQAVLQASQQRYTALVAADRGMLQAYDSARQRVDDVVELIKLQRSLELMERYQKTEKPGASTLQQELERIRMAEQRLRSALRP